MKFVVSVLVAVMLSGCASSSGDIDVANELSSVTSTTTDAMVTTSVASSVAGSQTSVASSVGSSVAGSQTSVASTDPSVVPTSIAKSNESSIPVASNSPSSTVRVTSTTVAVSRPKLSVSQTTNLNPNGTSVTVSGSGYDVSKGVYVIVCSQAAPGPQATCIGGVNIDGSSSSSVWVSSNPPNYAIGLTTPFQPDGSFNVNLVIVGKSGALDCTVLKCGVVTRSDHLRYTDRSQDVFVPITFSN